MYVSIRSDSETSVTQSEAGSVYIRPDVEIRYEVMALAGNAASSSCTHYHSLPTVTAAQTIEVLPLQRWARWGRRTGVFACLTWTNDRQTLSSEINQMRNSREQYNGDLKYRLWMVLLGEERSYFFSR